MARPQRHILPAVLAGATLVSGCVRDDETSMRDRLSPWFALGETLAFAAERGCAAGAFRLVHSEISASVPVADSVFEMLRALPRRGVAALDDPELTPDQAMMLAANAERPTGMRMRLAALEARACLEGKLGAEFSRLLVNSDTVFAFQTDEGAVMLLDRKNRVLVVVMGPRA